VAELIEPTSSDQSEVVENIFPVFLPPGIEGPLQEDLQSRGRMTEFLWDRLRRDHQPTPGGVITVVTGEQDYRTLLPRHHDTQYYLSDNNDGPTHWRRAAGIFLAANVMMNLLNGNAVSAVKDTVEAVQGVKDTVEDHFGIGDVTTARRVPHREPTTVERTETENLEFNSSGEAQRVGEAAVDQEIVEKVLDSIEARLSAGDTLQSASFSGVSSDDWRRDPARNGFGHANAGTDGHSENAGLAERRMELTRAELLKQAAERGIDLSNATFDAREAVLDEESILAVENAVMANGFDDYNNVNDAVDAALEIYNSDPESLPEPLRDVLHDRLPRGFQADLSYRVVEQVPGQDKTTYTHEKEKHHDGKPKNENHDYDLALIPLVLLPLPRFRREMRKRVLTDDIILPPQMPNPEYLKLYPAARTEQDTLVDEAWAYARKYQHLMRETNRVQGLYRLDYTDGEGDPQRLRAMFIDHEPTPDSLERVIGLLQTISQMQDGRVGRELDMIAIYPSENAGPEHGNPKLVGLGQDIQFEDHVLGVAYPALRLAEMHMPPDTSRDEMGMYMSPDWTLAHEVGGHFTDVNQEENELEPTGVTLANGAEVFTTNGRFDDFMQANYRQARAEEQSGRPSRWRVQRRVENINGEIVEMTHDVVDPARQPSRFRAVNAMRRAIHAIRNEHGGSMIAGDPRLAESIFVRKETGHPTRYGATAAAEHQAEAAASELVGQIPFEQAHDGAGIITREDEGFVSGYHVASRDRQALADRWGSDLAHEGVVFTDANGEPMQRTDWEHWYGRPQDDNELAELMNEARQTPVPDEADLLHIVTGRRI
jgi:hypothetical protein